ncbi:unnamed protein product [Symbiodinium natans]|uniref:Uncharacterized protein n=1 Tax=Symbiodinium natans TaxID=878477 RepID=A0A812RWZ1_9DINO|nr:unnamed protein product [Symbiodinium natans]
MSDRGIPSPPRCPHIGQGLGSHARPSYTSFPIALQSRAGIDAVVAAVRAALDGRPDAVVVSASTTPSPEPQAVCTRPTTFWPSWTTVVTVATRARPALDQVVGTVEADCPDCGIASNLGPCTSPEQLGADVWRGNRPTHVRGMVVLGSPVGHPDFVQAWAVAKMAEEREFLQHLPQLSICSVHGCCSPYAPPRANHALGCLRRSARPSRVGHSPNAWKVMGARTRTSSSHAN